MSLVETKKDSKYPFYIRLLFFSQKRKYGKVLEAGKLWGLSPRLFLGVAHLFRAIERRSSPIPAELRALLTVRVSQINNCSFCVDINSARVLNSGGTKHKLLELDHFLSSEHFSPPEKAALELAEKITHTGQNVDAHLLNRLKLHYSEAAIVELCGIIAFQNLSSKFNAALDVKPQGFCQIPVKGKD